MGVKTSIIGFSFSDRATDQARRAMVRLPHGVRLACRDPHSASRVRLLTERSVEENADLAFLLESREASDLDFTYALKAIENCRASGKVIIGININRQAFGVGFEKDPERAIDAYERLIREISDHTSAAFVLVPHDFRGIYSDEMLLQRLKDRTENDLEIIMVERRVRADEAKCLAGRLDLMITGRMHLAIASLGMSTPALVHDYQGKVSGLLSLFQLDGHIFGTGDLISQGPVLQKCLSVIAERGCLERAISSKLPGIKALSRRNIGNI